MRIGIIDSGIGGLTVLREVVKNFPQNEYIYIADNKNIPFGNKTKDEIISLTTAMIDFLLEKNIDILIIGSGTISAILGVYIKNIVNIPVYNVITPTLDYLKNTKYKNIAFSGTSATINSELLSDIDYLKVACPNLAPLIEKDKNSIEIINALKEDLTIIKNNKCDALVLGCTHFQIIDYLINDFFESKVRLFSLGSILCKYLDLTNEGSFNIKLYFTDVSDDLKRNVREIIPYKYELKETKL